MSRLILKNIKFKAFRSFVKDQDSGELPESGLVGIFGKNNDTGGSNGSGKSNFHLAIPFAFGYSHIPATELQSILTEEPMQVQVDFAFDGKEYSIKRGETTSFTVDGTEITGAKTTNGKIGSLLPINLDLLDALTFRPQRSMGRFMSMTDSERKEFLAQLLSIHSIENAIAESKLNITAIEKKLADVQSKLGAFDSVKASFVPQQPVLFETESLLLKQEEIDIKMQFLKAEISFLDSKIQVFVDKVREIQAIVPVFSSPLVKDVTEATQTIDLLDKQINQLTAEFSKKQKGLSQEILTLEKVAKAKFGGSSIQSSIDSVKALIKAAEGNECSTCHQQWIVNTATLGDFKARLAELTEMNTVLLSLKQELDSLKLDSVEDMQKEKLRLSDLRNSLNKQIKIDSDKALADFKAKQKEEVDKIIKESTPLTNDRSDKKLLYASLTQELYDLKSDISYKTGANKQKMLEYQRNLDNYAAMEAKNTALTNELTGLQKDFNVEQDFQALLKSFLNNIMEEVLSEIAQEANSKLARLNNTNSVTIQFLTERITQKNSIKEEIRPVLFKNGREVSTKYGLSGGQFASVEWAVDLAINNVISRRTGFNPGWLVLDEPFHNHDTVTRESCLELLKQEADDKLILVVEHAVETNELFDKKIFIESNNDESVIKGFV